MFDLFRSRDKAVRILLGAILMIVALSMVTYLIPSTGTGSGGDPRNDSVAEIGKDKITATDAQLLIQGALRGRQIPNEMLGFYVPQVVQQLITERALAYEAKRLGLQVSDEDTANAIQSQLPAGLFQDGKLNKDAYASILAQQNLTIGQFEQNMQRQVLVNRLRQVVLEGVVVSPAEVEQEFRSRNEKVKIEYVMVAPAKYQAEAAPSLAAMQAYYDKNRGAFQTPEKKSLAILVLDPAKMESSITPSDADLQREYNNNRDRFRSPERVNVRHILLMTDSAKKNDAEVRAKAEDLLKQLHNGADFAALAKQYSQDTSSAVKGGDVGWVVHGQTVKAFDQAAFSLKPKELSNLVKTEYGYHILQVMDKEPAHLKSFEEVKAELSSGYKKKRVNDSIQSLADKAHADLRKDPLHPEKAAEDIQQPLVKVENVQPGDPVPQLGVSKEFEDSIAGLKKGEVSQPVVVSGNRIAMAVVTNVIPAHPAGFEEAQPQIRTRLQKENLDKLVVQRANELLAKAQSMKGNLSKAAQAMGLEVKTSADIDRQGAVEGVGTASILADAFTKPEGALFGPVSAQDGKVVGKVIGKTPPNMTQFAAGQNAIREELKSKKARERESLFAEGLRKRLISEKVIKVHQDVIDRIIAGYHS